MTSLSSEVSPAQPTSRSTDCLDLDVVCSGNTRVHVSPVLRSTCAAASSRMRKYQATLQLRNSHCCDESSLASFNNSCSDMSQLDLVSMDSSRADMTTMSALSTPSIADTTTYYTLDAKRLASKHKKNQQDRYSVVHNIVISAIIALFWPIFTQFYFSQLMCSLMKDIMLQNIVQQIFISSSPCHGDY